MVAVVGVLAALEDDGVAADAGRDEPEPPLLVVVMAVAAEPGRTEAAGAERCALVSVEMGDEAGAVDSSSGSRPSHTITCTLSPACRRIRTASPCDTPSSVCPFTCDQYERSVLA